MTMEFDPRREMRKLQKKMGAFDHRFLSNNNNNTYSTAPSQHRINIWRPTVTIKDNKTHISITFELAGLSREQVSIEVTKENTLIISGEKKSKLNNNNFGATSSSSLTCPVTGNNNNNNNINTTTTSPSSTSSTTPLTDIQQKNTITIGKFIRSYKLPPGTDPSKIKATMDDGLLEISIPKENIESLKIPIQSKL